MFMTADLLSENFPRRKAEESSRPPIKNPPVTHRQTNKSQKRRGETRQGNAKNQSLKHRQVLSPPRSTGHQRLFCLRTRAYKPTRVTEGSLSQLLRRQWATRLTGLVKQVLGGEADTCVTAGYGTLLLLLVSLQHIEWPLGNTGFTYWPATMGNAQWNRT